MHSFAPWALYLVLFVPLLQSHEETLQRRTVTETPKNVELPPPGMSSLTFVFDRTGSMNDDLNQVLYLSLF